MLIHFVTRYLYETELLPQIFIKLINEILVYHEVIFLALLPIFREFVYEDAERFLLPIILFPFVCNIFFVTLGFNFGVLSVYFENQRFCK